MTNKRSAEDWPWNWFGFWGDVSLPDGELPALADFVDPDWNPDHKEGILEYLTRAPVILAASAGHAKCLLCPEMLAMAAFQSDGEWLWPTSLRHYATAHAVRIPVRFES